MIIRTERTTSRNARLVGAVESSYAFCVVCACHQAPGAWRANEPFAIDAIGAFGTRTEAIADLAGHRARGEARGISTARRARCVFVARTGAIAEAILPAGGHWRIFALILWIATEARGAAGAIF